MAPSGAGARGAHPARMASGPLALRPHPAPTTGPFRTGFSSAEVIEMGLEPTRSVLEPVASVQDRREWVPPLNFQGDITCWMTWWSAVHPSGGPFFASHQRQSSWNTLRRDLEVLWTTNPAAAALFRTMEALPDYAFDFKSRAWSPFTRTLWALVLPTLWVHPRQWTTAKTRASTTFFSLRRAQNCTMGGGPGADRRIHTPTGVKVVWTMD